MVSSNNQLGVTLTAKDEISATMRRVEGHTRNLDKAFGSLGARLKTGLQMHVLNNALGMLDRAFRKVADAIPDLIQRGEEWAAVVNDITDATGMSAQKASELAGVQKLLTGSADGLGTAFKALSKSVTEHASDWKDYGVQIARSSDGNVDAYQTFQNLRQAVSATGAGTLSFAAAQKLAGRGASALLDILQLSNRQWALYADQARRSGLILTEAGAKAAEQWGRTKNLLDSAITGIGSQVLQGIAPTLMGLTNAVTGVIQKNMGNIVRFVSGAIQFVASMIGQFLGVDLGINLIDQMDSAGTAAGTAGQKLDKQGASAKKAAAGQRDLSAALRAVRDAERDLAAARGQSIFGANMSDADVILAKQARAASIAAAQERLADAKKALREHTKTMGAITETNAKALDAMGIKWKRFTGEGGPVTDGLRQTLADSKTFGAQIADSIQDAIFGPDTQIQLGGGKPITIRSGGIIGALQGVQKWLQTMSTNLTTLSGLLGDSGPLVVGVAGLLGLRKIAGLASSAAQFASNYGWQGMLGIGAGATAGLVGQEIINQQDRRQGLSYEWFAALNGMLGRDYNSDLDRADAKHKGQSTLEYLLDLNSTLKWWTDLFSHGSKPPSSYGNPNQNPGMFPPPGGFAAAYPPDYQWQSGGPTLTPDWVKDHPLLGFGITGADVGLDRLGEIERSLGVGGTATSLLERVESAIYSASDAITTALDGIDSGGGSPTGLGSRVTHLERQMTGVDDSALKTANQRQDKSIRGLVNVNRVQGEDIRDRVTITNYNKGYRANATQHRSFGNMLDNHERRLDKLDGGGGSNPDRRGAAARVTLVLDAKETRRLFHRGVATTTLSTDS